MCLGELGVVTAVDTAAATVDIVSDTARRTASCLLHPGVRVGDHVLVHTGFVVDVLDPSDGVGSQASGGSST